MTWMEQEGRKRSIKSNTFVTQVLAQGLGDLLLTVVFSCNRCADAQYECNSHSGPILRMNKQPASLCCRVYCAPHFVELGATNHEPCFNMLCKMLLVACLSPNKSRLVSQETEHQALFVEEQTRSAGLYVMVCGR